MFIHSTYPYHHHPGQDVELFQHLRWLPLAPFPASNLSRCNHYSDFDHQGWIYSRFLIHIAKFPSKIFVGNTFPSSACESAWVLTLVVLPCKGDVLALKTRLVTVSDQKDQSRSQPGVQLGSRCPQGTTDVGARGGGQAQKAASIPVHKYVRNNCSVISLFSFLQLSKFL